MAESPFAAVRLRTGAAKRFKKVENATALICKMLLIVEQNFRKLKAAPARRRLRWHRIRRTHSRSTENKVRVSQEESWQV